MFCHQDGSALLLHKLSGYGVALACGLFLVSIIPGASWAYMLSACCYWSVFIIAWPRLNPRNKKQIRLLLGVAIIALVVAYFYDVDLDFFSLIEGNLGIVAMLSGVSLLGLLPDSVKQKTPILGVKGVLSTWSSVHVLGAVINMSSVFLVGDKLQRNTGSLSQPQYSILIRALTSAGFWSPFFASMAVALSVAPNAEFHQLAIIGVPMAVMSCLISLWEFNKKGTLAEFAGFPLAFHALLFPISLASSVLVFHYFIMPDLAILSIVTLLSPISVITLLLVKSGSRYTKQRLEDHIHIRLPNMANEVSLFLSAGLLTKAVSLALAGALGESWSLFDSFGFVEAFACFIGICGIALLGLHPIVGISLMSSLVPAEGANNTLLAFVCLCSWGVGTAISPLSGINLSVAGKYAVDNFQLARANLLYGVVLSLVVAVAMFFLAWTIGV
ncbi:hypothetical protein [Marinomonas pollencensis]|uniref:Uncharacterized protein n=1 Tax=Marinomonas pollencensis TaxID=491954 RepID=A0A3E0DLK2_9GAMM|nr:hypothetical protein [Marinomonas pollencensis]REG83720.1 hypothetical protein DFP81_10586 [Marinomonas pollencensis]